MTAQPNPYIIYMFTLFEHVINLTEPAIANNCLTMKV